MELPKLPGEEKFTPREKEILDMVRADLVAWHRNLWPAVGAAMGAGLGAWVWEMISKLLR